jgi:hypothetical protein
MDRASVMWYFGRLRRSCVAFSNWAGARKMGQVVKREFVSLLRS